MTPPTIDAAYAALLRDDRATARSIVGQLLAQNPKDAQAWLMLGGLVDAPSQKQDCLRRVLAIDPVNESARRGLAAIEEEQRRAAMPPPPPVQPVALSGPAGPVAPIGGYAPAPLMPSGITTSMTLPAGYVPPLEEPGRRSKAAFPYVPVLVGGLLLSIIAVMVLVSVRRAQVPVKVPQVSAQTRTTDFINSLFAFMTRREFYDLSKREKLLDSLIVRYVVPSERGDFVEDFNEAMEEVVGAEEQELFLQTVRQSYASNVAYTVASESPTRITLKVRSGELWYLFRNGSSHNIPLKTLFSEVTLRNIDGVWYLASLE